MHGVKLTSFLMTLRSLSRFTIRNFTGNTKERIVKHSAFNMSLHKSCSPFLFSYIYVSLCLEEFRSSPKQPLPAPAFQPQPQPAPHPGLCLGGLYAAAGCRNSLLLPGRIIMMCKTVGLVFLQSVHIVKTVE